MKNIALFRYHTNLKVCRNHLQIFRYFNPDVPVFGIYGGPESEFDFFTNELSEFLVQNYSLSNLDGEEKWKDFDIALFDWYKNVGTGIDFDQMYLLEWDFILFQSIQEAYNHVPPGAAGFTGLIPIEKIQSLWYWTSDPVREKEWEELLQFAKTKYNHNLKPYGIYCPGLTLPKQFFITAGNYPLPKLGNDELRFPIYAQLCGLQISDTGFFKKWFSKREMKYFNCNGFEIADKRIVKQIKKKKGRRAFHPVRRELQIELFLPALSKRV